MNDQQRLLKRMDELVYAMRKDVESLQAAWNPDVMTRGMSASAEFISQYHAIKALSPDQATKRKISDLYDQQRELFKQLRSSAPMVAVSVPSDHVRAAQNELTQAERAEDAAFRSLLETTNHSWLLMDEVPAGFVPPKSTLLEAAECAISAEKILKPEFAIRATSGFSTVLNVYHSAVSKHDESLANVRHAKTKLRLLQG